VKFEFTFDMMVFGQRVRLTRPLFNVWINKYGFNVVLLGHQFQVARPDTKYATAKKLQKEGPLSACLSTLYAYQGWLKEMRERPFHGWVDGIYGTITRVPPPHRHGGRGRTTLEVTPNKEEVAFLRDAIGFEFGGDVAPAQKEA